AAFPRSAARRVVRRPGRIERQARHPGREAEEARLDEAPPPGLEALVPLTGCGLAALHLGPIRHSRLLLDAVVGDIQLIRSSWTRDASVALVDARSRVGGGGRSRCGATRALPRNLIRATIGVKRAQAVH